MDLFSALGFKWNRSKIPDSIPTHSIERVSFRFHQMLSVFVWDASVLEGNPFTYPEVKTLLEGVTVGGRKISDQEQVLNLAESSKQLLALVKAGKFVLNKSLFTELHGLVAKNEALEWGHFRGEGPETNYTPDVGLGPEGRYTPLPTLAGAPELNRVFSGGIQALEKELQEVQKNGTANDDEELELGVSCIAAGIYDDSNTMVAGLSISAPTDRINRDWTKALVDTALQISRGIGYQAPP